MSFQESILDPSQLRLQGNFDAQVDQLLSWIRLTKAEVENLEILVQDVNATLGRQWPGSEIYPFGSIVTGLGIRTSDVDIYMSLPHKTKAHKKLVYTAKAILQCQPNLFRNLSAIPMAKVPIVKFYHVPTGRNCDINFSSEAGVQNSKLLAYLLHLDPRGIPLAVLIKYWSKVHNLTGTNLMPNYALILLVIFYLQHLKIVPSVLMLQQDAREYMVNGWNTAFNKIYFNNNNDLTVYQLLGGFFDFYSNFKFNDFVISTYLGETVNRVCFQEWGNVPTMFHLYRSKLLNSILATKLRIDTKMCIQDPFEHSRNCAVAVHQKLYDKVVGCFRNAAQQFYKQHSDRYLKALLTKEYYSNDRDLEIVNIEYRKRQQKKGKVMKQRNDTQNNVNKNFKRNLHMLFEQLRKQKRPS